MPMVKFMMASGSRLTVTFSVRSCRGDLPRHVVLQCAHTKAERCVLEAVSLPLLAKLHYAFLTPKKMYMVLEKCAGGKLFFHLSRAGRFSEGRCKFNESATLLGIEYLHSLVGIYRDLKPENLLFDSDGHAKITEFGLSKEGTQDNASVRTMCGTPEFLAPVIVDKRGHGKAWT